jgi:hypothetical protein
MRTLLMVLFLVGCAPPAHDANPGGGGGGGGDRGGNVGPSGMSGSGGTVATGGTSGSAGAPAADAAVTIVPDADVPADSAASKADRAPASTGPGKIVLIAGGGNGGDGTPAAMASTTRPFGVATDPINGDVYIAEQVGRIRRIDDKGIITTVMGTGATGPAAKIGRLTQPHNLLFQPNTRNLFVGDTFASRIIKMDATTGEAMVFPGASGRTYCLAFDAAGDHLYVTGSGVTIIDLKTMETRRVNTGTPRVIAVDSKSNLYFGGGGSLSMADPMGKISAVMGSGGLSAPKHLSVDNDDNVIITDTESHTIRKYMIATKSVVKIAGGGSGTLDGDPNMAKLARPHGAFMDAQGRIFIADSSHNRVLRIDY